MGLYSRQLATGLACLVWALAGTSGCDPKAGFESAAGAIDPSEKSYVDGPGSRLTAGPFNTVGIDFDVDTQVHLIGRRRDDLGKSITLFGQDAQSGCTIAPNAATWFPSKPPGSPYRLLPFFESRDPNGAGTLRFSDIDCKVEPYTVDNALGPSGPSTPGLERGFLVRQNGGLVLADPWAGTTQTIVVDLRRLIAIGTQFLVWGDAQLIAFDSDLTELGRFGNNVKMVTDLDFGSAFAVEDADGLHSLVPVGARVFSFTLVDKDACALTSSPNELGLVLVHSPCNDDHLVAEAIDTTGVANVQRQAFATRADSRSARVVGFSIAGAMLSNLIAFYSNAVDPATGLGTLFAAQAEGDPVQLGANAALERAQPLEVGGAWAGIAVVDVQNGLGRLVRWRWDGSVETLAENVDRAASGPGFLANYDGHSGDVVGVDFQGNASTVESGAPAFNTALRSGDDAWALRLEHFDGVTGDLTLAKGLGSEYETAAHRVPPNKYRFMTLVPLPGFAYLADYDETSLTGTLYVRNIDLGSTLSVAKNVSDFVATNYPLPGILYSVPIGADAGIWFARAK